MARDTIYKLYKTGRIDPTYSNIWAFSNSIERDNYLNSRPSLTFTDIKYWRVGEPIKIPIRYEMSFEYDYIRISNDTQDVQLARNWYCFITARAYISPSVTLLTLAVDYVQTFYFTSGVPFWRVNAFVTQSTFGTLPPVGTPADYPVPNTKTESIIYESSDYALVLYSTISPANAAAGNFAYTTSIIDGVPMAASPYILYASSSAGLIAKLRSTLDAYNTHGMSDAISAIYLIPSDYVSAIGKSGDWVDGTIANVLITKQVIVPVPNYSQALGEYTDLITQYGYFSFVINNGQGETAAFNFNEFNGAPVFNLTPTISAGSPVLICSPVNLKYNQQDWRNRCIKITQAPSAGWLNDSYKIWLAQTQNSRAAAIDGANLSIAQAKEARDNSWAYKYGTTVKNLESSLINSVRNGIEAETGPNAPAPQFLQDFFTRAGGYDVSGDPDKITLMNGEVFSFSAARAKRNTPTETTRLGGNSKLADALQLGAYYINNQLGIETTYQFDQAVANAQQNLRQLLASYQDKARIPATARGSNAFGDVTKFKQYGFMFATYGPDSDSLILIYNMIKSGGATTNKYMEITKHHATFDFVAASSAKIAANASIRPEFVRKLMLDLLQSGVFLWYVKNGDISPDIGSPYGVTNEVVT